MKPEKLPYTPLQKCLELTAWLICLLSLALAIYGMNTLPDTIAIHFDIAGNPDGYGSPGTLLITPIIGILCLGMISLISHLLDPNVWNIPFQVKPQNKTRVYTIIRTMVFALGLELSIWFGWMEYKCFRQNAKGMFLMLGIFLLALTLTLVLSCVWAWNYNKEN